MKRDVEMTEFEVMLNGSRGTSRLWKAAQVLGVKTVQEANAHSDAEWLACPNFGAGSLSLLRWLLETHMRRAVDRRIDQLASLGLVTQTQDAVAPTSLGIARVVLWALLRDDDFLAHAIDEAESNGGKLL